MATINGTAGNDNLTGTSGNDTFNLSAGGNDTASGLDGDDIFNLGAAFNAADKIDGGTGYDKVNLNGDYTGANALVMGATTLANVEEIDLAAGHSYNLTLNAATVDSQGLYVNAGLLGATDALNFDGSADTGTSLNILAGSGNDTIIGGGGADLIGLGLGGVDKAVGGGGDDYINVSDQFTAADSIDGGTGNDEVVLHGNYTGASAVVFGAATMVNVEKLTLGASFNYDLTTNDATVAAGQTLTVVANLAPANSLNFDGSAESNGNFNITSREGFSTLTGGAGNDVFNLVASFNAGDSIKGGAGTDQLVLNGDYTGANAVVFGATTVAGVEGLFLSAGHSYALTTDDATVAGGQTLAVNASNLGPADSLTFDGSAETDGRFIFAGGAGNDALIGGAGEDTFKLGVGGNDTVRGGGGNDTFTLGAAFTAADSISGGAGVDRVILDGDYTGLNAVVFGAATMVGVETLSLTAGHSYDLTTNNTTVALGATLTVKAQQMGAGDSLAFDGSAETNGFFTVLAGAGNDVISGGARADNFELAKGGNDAVNGGGGDDFFDLGASLTAADRINGGAGNDTVVLDGNYAAGLVLSSSTMASVETIDLARGHSYNVTTSNSTVVGAGMLTVDGSGLGATDHFTFNASAETTSDYYFYGGAGTVTLTGGGGNDTFDMENHLTAADHIDGGGINNGTEEDGQNTLILNGDYSAGFVLSASAIKHIELIDLGGGHSYTLTAGANFDVSTNDGLTIDASGLDSGDTLKFDGSADPNASMEIDAGSGLNLLKGNGETQFHFVHGFSAANQIDGGGAQSEISFGVNSDNGSSVPLSLVLTPTTIVNVGSLDFQGDVAYSVTTDNATVAAGQTLTVLDDLDSSGSLNFNGAAETDGNFQFYISAGIDVITGGSGADFFQIQDQFETLTARGNGGADIFSFSDANGSTTLVYGAAADSTSTGYDQVYFADYANVKFDVPGAIGAIDADVTTGNLSTATFDSDLAAAIGSGQLAAHHAVFFTPSGGDLWAGPSGGANFLIVDVNGTAGYQAGQDLVIEMIGATGTPTTANFI
jgi:hypothetical protein